MNIVQYLGELEDNLDDCLAHYEKGENEKPVGYMILKLDGKFVENGRIFKTKGHIKQHINANRKYDRHKDYLKDGAYIIPIYAVYSEGGTINE